MPSVTLPGRAFISQPWRESRFNRRSSTAQEMKSFRDSEQTSAMLHGSRRREQPSGITNVQQRQTEQTTSASHNASQPQKHTQQARHKQNSQQQHSKDQSKMGRKRRAGAHTDQRPSQRQRLDQPKTPHPPLKDEAHIRSAMHVPNSEEYPDAPRGVFKSPKEFIARAADGLAKLHAEHTEMARGAFQCTLHYKSAARTDVVSAEGKSKVRAISMQDRLILRIYRNLPKQQRTSICYAHSMSREYLQKFSTGSLVSIRSTDRAPKKPWQRREMQS